MKLILRLNSSPGTEFKETIFGAEGGMIGRKPGGALHLPDPDRIVSSEHAYISLDDSGFWIKDLSLNGTFLNNAPDPIGRGCKTLIQDGDSLRIGRYELRITVEGNNSNIQSHTDNSTEKLDLPDPFEMPAVSTSSHNEPVSERHKIDTLINDKTDPFDLSEQNNLKLKNEVAQTTQSQKPQNESLDTHFVPPQSSGDIIPENWWEDTSTEEMTAENSDEPMVNAPSEVDDQILSEVSQDQLDPQVFLENTQPSENFHHSGINQKETAQNEQTLQPAMSSKQDTMVDDYFKDFLIGAGLELPASLERSSVAQDLGIIFRELISGVLNLLTARTAIRNELRLSKTIIGARENNPLKFSVHVRDAMNRLIAGEQSGFMHPVEATREVLADLQAHEIALMSGIEAGVGAVLEVLDPEVIKRMSGRGIPGMGSGLPKKYQELHDNLKSEMHERSNGVFWRAFSEAYERQVEDATRRMTDRHRAEKIE